MDQLPSLGRLIHEIAVPAKQIYHPLLEKHRFETIIIDYRLVKHGAKFPSGTEDLDRALNWIDQRYSGLNRDAYVLGIPPGQ